MMVLIAGCLLCGCEKGYDLPLEEAEQEEAATECKEMMKKIQGIYKLADKGEASNVVLQDETMLEMQKAVIETGCPVSVTIAYSDMGNYEKADQFLTDCKKGKSGSVVIYDVR